ncbi:MAG: hypothetical protein CM15mP51_05530 [Porticoccaceae bacterium]|nr:MAG: hypothetical protein CM15mP51_05530 [Porticoccaceae bacterium]
MQRLLDSDKWSFKNKIGQTMTINDVNNGANIAPPVVQPKATPKKPEVAAPIKRW